MLTEGLVNTKMGLWILGDGGNVILDFLAESVRQAGKSPL